MKTFQLTTPIKRASGTLCQNVVARDYVTAGDLLFARRFGAGDDVAVSFGLIARMIGFDTDEFEDLDMRDVSTLQDYVSELMSKKAPQTDGATSP